MSAHEADANPSGGAEGALGTDVPVLLVPPVVLGVLALVGGVRRRRSHR
ncbi:hypothetical protein [Klenkia brasiliensis]|nr:hypothetical protein [Klenkia brasiliensis]